MATAFHVITFEQLQCTPALAQAPSQTARKMPSSVDMGRRANLQIQGVMPASRLGARPAPLTISTGIAELDSLTGGLPRGALSEVVGAASSGRTTVLTALLAAASARQEVCALVDASDAFDPHSAAAAGVDLKRVLWIRCHSETGPRSSFPISRQKRNRNEQRTRNEQCATGVQQALKAADLLLQSGGFGVVVIDLADVPSQVARRVPLTSWFRFCRAVEHTSTVLLVIEREAYAKSCAALVIKLSAIGTQQSENQPSAVRTWQLSNEGAREQPSHARLFTGFQTSIEVIRDRTERKPVQSAMPTFRSKPAWVG